jgi:hypothetical protein
MASIYIAKWQQFHDDSGDPLNGGSLTFYLTTTTTAKSAYPTEADAIAGTNGFTTRTLDADGRCPTEVWLSGRYRIITKTSAGTTIADDDPIEDTVNASDFQGNTPTWADTASGTNTVALTLTPAITAYEDGMPIRFRVANDCTGAVTVNVNSVGAKSLVKWNGSALISGDLQQNDVVTIVFDETNDRFQLQAPVENKLARLDTNQSFTKAQGVDRSALTDAATIAVDASLSNVFTVTLGGNRTLGAPTNPKDGQSITIFITQDGTGSRTLAYHADWLFAGGVDPTLTTTAAAVDVLTGVYNGATTKWYAVLNKAFA